MKRLFPLLIVATFVVPVLTAACSGTSPPAPGSAPAATTSQATPEDKQWTMPNKNYASTRYSALDSDQRRQRQEPQGRLDVLHRRAARPRRRTAGGRQHHVRAHAVSEHRLRARPERRKARRSSGSTRRSRIRRSIPVACCDTVNRGLAYADGKIFLNQLDTTTVALDAETGKELWKVKQGDYKQGQTITAAPLVIKDKVISGISGGEFGVRGFVTANDVKTGKQIWRMYSTGPEAEVGFPGSVETWKGDEWKRGGGTTWGWYSYDPELNLFYYGTGNPGSWNPGSASRATTSGR